MRRQPHDQLLDPADLSALFRFPRSDILPQHSLLYLPSFVKDLKKDRSFNEAFRSRY